MRRQKEHTDHSSIIHSYKVFPKQLAARKFSHRDCIYILKINGGEKKAKKSLKASSEKSDSCHYLLWKMVHQSSRLSSFIIAHVCSPHKSFHRTVSCLYLYMLLPFYVSFILLFLFFPFNLPLRHHFYLRHLRMAL